MSVILFLQRLKHYLYWFFIALKVFFIHHFGKQKKCIFILATPRHGNMGDHAIVYSQYKLFESVGCKKNVFEFNHTTYEVCKKQIQKIAKPQDIIIIDGGGNIGTLWISEEYLMREIINRFHNNPIMIMPQTAHFEDSEYGQTELQKSIEAYCKHPDLTIFCRDEVTYNLISTKYDSVKSFYVPDMVMYLSDIPHNYERKGALICFREDLESTCPNETKNRILDFIHSKNICISQSSTVIERRVDFFQRKKVLFEKWAEFSKSEFIITDRLHGMVFCAITGTPCLAIDNVSHKVRDGYKWLEHLPYILYCDDYDSVLEQVDCLIKLSNEHYDYNNEPLMQYYETIRQQVKNKL